MSGRNHNNQQRGQSTDLLDELNSIRDLLGSDAAADIPLLDQIAEAPAHPPRQPAPLQPAAPRAPLQTPKPLDERDLPILFSPVDEELPEEFRAELNESDRELLRPLQELPKARDTRAEEQPGLFDTPARLPAENPFLPAHIRARLTGGRVPSAQEPLSAAPKIAEPGADAADALLQTAPESLSAPEVNAGQTAKSTSSEAQPAAPAEAAKGKSQREQLIDQLVAKQLPELERQLRERIARMIDELEAKR